MVWSLTGETDSRKVFVIVEPLATWAPLAVPHPALHVLLTVTQPSCDPVCLSVPSSVPFSPVPHPSFPVPPLPLPLTLSQSLLCACVA